MILISYIRCKQIEDRSMATLVNEVLNSLDSKYKYRLRIWGACWSTRDTTAEALVEHIIKNVPKAILKEIVLHNRYSVSAVHTKKAFNDKIHRNIAHIDPTNALDHSKVFVIEKYLDKISNKRELETTEPAITELEDNETKIPVLDNTEVILFMTGSTNFSKNSYIENPKNESDVLFVKMDESTNKIFTSLIAGIEDDPIKGLIEKLLSEKQYSPTSHSNNLTPTLSGLGSTTTLFSSKSNNDYLERLKKEQLTN